MEANEHSIARFSIVYFTCLLAILVCIWIHAEVASDRRNGIGERDCVDDPLQRINTYIKYMAGALLVSRCFHWLINLCTAQQLW